MSVLPNAKYERFAQELAKGKTADEAYVLAGYSENRGNATRLKANESVLSRVAELQERGAKRAEITVESIKDMLLEDRLLARSLGQSAAAVSAVEKLAKLYGHMVDRKEVRTGQLDELPPDTVAELREQLNAERTRRADSGDRPQAGSKPH